MAYIARVTFKVGSSKRAYWIRPEGTPNASPYATPFDTEQAARDYVAFLSMPYVYRVEVLVQPE